MVGNLDSQARGGNPCDAHHRMLGYLLDMIRVQFARRRRRPVRGETVWCLRMIAAGLVLMGCATTPPAPTSPAPNAGQVALAATRASSFDVPYRLLFEWSIIEPGSRLRGRGVARIEPPSLARLDLFTSNGERVAAAALDGDVLRVADDGQTEVPPPALLWGTLGVFRPGPETGLMGGRRYPNGKLELRYEAPGGAELLYTLRDDRVERIDALRDGRAREEVTLVRVESERFPRQATYRHLGEVRELRITLESVEHVESYPTDIWNLGF